MAPSRWLSRILGILVTLGTGLPGVPSRAGEVHIPLAGGRIVPAAVHSIKELRVQGITMQQLDFSCGTAALSTLFNAYLNQPYSEGDIINFIVRNGDYTKFLTRKGFSLLDLKLFAEAHGIKAIGYEFDFAALCEMECPVLIPLYHKDRDLRHFVIFRGALDERVFLADPAVGRQSLLRSDFEALWTPKVGMVFMHPDGTIPTNTLLHVHPDKETFLSAETLRPLVLQSVMQYIHEANEF
jgi:predicted double-glycine peptidase